MHLTIVSKFGFAELVSSPETGRREFGVPPGGWFDSVSAQLTLALLNQEASLPILEVANCALQLIAERDISLAICGFGHEVLLNSHSVPMNSRIVVSKGSRIELAPTSVGCRCYLGTSGQLLGQTRLAEPPFDISHRIFRYVPEHECVETEAEMTPIFDRVGLRLRSTNDLKISDEPRSRPSIFGAIQVPHCREILIHGPDGPTIGGYPRLGTIISSDLPKLGQLKSQDVIQLLPVTKAIAVEEFLLEQRELAKRIHQIRLISKAQ